MNLKSNISYASFWQKHFKRILQGGVPALFKKTRNVVLLFFPILVVIFIRCLRPLLFIRFGELYASRIGHFAANTELYLCERDAGNQGNNSLDIFFFGWGTICNKQLAKMWRKHLYVFSFVKILHLANSILPGGEKYTVPMPSDRDVYGYLMKFPPHLAFTPEEEIEGYKVLQSMGVTKATSFVCIHDRDSAYLDQTYPDENWRYHDYRDTNINNYIKCAEELAKRGYVVFRMGAIVKNKLETNNPMIIDYANIARSDFMDIFLEAKCSFHLGGPTGLNAVPIVFRRPRAIVNCCPLEDIYTWDPNELFILKKMWLLREQKFMTFREIFESGVGRFYRAEEFEKYGLKVVDNTPEEIMAVGIEMDERLRGTWQTNEGDEVLQRRFWELFPKGELHGEILSRIGSEFLRQNKELLN